MPVTRTKKLLILLHFLGCISISLFPLQGHAEPREISFSPQNSTPQETSKNRICSSETSGALKLFANLSQDILQYQRDFLNDKIANANLCPLVSSLLEPGKNIAEIVPITLADVCAEIPPNEIGNLLEEDRKAAKLFINQLEYLNRQCTNVIRKTEWAITDKEVFRLFDLLSEIIDIPSLKIVSWREKLCSELNVGP